MKKEIPIRTLLGITQEDISMLLGVSRGQWSMFELGKRDLPIPAKLLLAEMLQHMKSAEAQPKKTNTPPQATPQQLESLLRENEYQRLRLSRKIAEATKKQQTQERLLQLAAFLKHRETGKSAPKVFFDRMAIKAAEAETTAFSETMALQHHRLEWLELEKQWLESKQQALRSAKP